MAKFLLIDADSGRESGFDDGWKLFDTLEEVQSHLKSTALEVQESGYRDGLDNWEAGLELFEVGERIAIRVENTIAISLGQTRTDIPAPMPTETVGDYARRISGG